MSNKVVFRSRDKTARKLFNLSMQAIGGLSQTSKMEGYSYNLPSSNCISGTTLRCIPGSVCSECYCRRNNYLYPCVQNAMNRRLTIIQKVLAESANGNIHPEIFFVNEFSNVLRDLNVEIFRWHDSGDLQGVDHLDIICEIARKNQQIKFWLPTKEIFFVTQYLKSRQFPKNLFVRISLPMVNQLPNEFIKSLSKHGISFGVVFDSEHFDEQYGECHFLNDAKMFFCPSKLQGSKCNGDFMKCRMCYERNRNIVYRKA